MLASLIFAAALATEPTMLPTPFTADQIRDAMPFGAHILIRTRSEAGEGSLDWTVTEATATHVRLRTLVTPEGGAPLEPHELYTSWSELRTHAQFSSAEARRVRARVVTPFGKLDGWKYVVRRIDDEGVKSREVMWFADAMPGPPMRMWTLTTGGSRWWFEQVERTPLPGEAAPTPPDQDTATRAPHG